MRNRDRVAARVQKKQLVEGEFRGDAREVRTRRSLEKSFRILEQLRI